MANQLKQANQLLLSVDGSKTIEKAPIASVPKSTSDSMASQNKTAPLAPVQPLPYQAEQQIKLLNLQSDVESLLAHLQTVEQERLEAKPQTAIQEHDDLNT